MVTILTPAELWINTHGPGKERYRKEATEQFKKDPFTEKTGSIRQLVEMLANPAYRDEICSWDGCEYLTFFHPNAFPILLEFGQEYTAKITRKPPAIEPLTSGCFENATHLAKSYNRPGVRTRLMCVEGLAIGTFTPPMLHAWNTLDEPSSRAFDWTHYPVTRWTRYWGIPFTTEEYGDLSSDIFGGKHSGHLFHHKYFSIIEGKLTSILKSRGKIPPPD